MREPARLTAELLARKGQALPTSGFAHASLAFDHLTTLARPLLLPAHTVAGPEAPAGNRRTAGEDRRQPAAGRREGDRVALTVRLDRERHRRLRIFGAHHECSSQDVIVRALDAYLETCGQHCACLRGKPEDCIRN